MDIIDDCAVEKLAAKESGEEEDDNDEALSLCDLPLIHHSENENPEQPIQTQHPQQEFDFCSLSEQPKMCSADEIFYQGQILPSRPGSESMGHHLMISSRSSSTSSGRSTAAASSSKLPSRNQFHSHPRPCPRQLHSHRNKSPSAWNVFRLGLVAAPPEMALRDLKTRLPNKNQGNGTSDYKKKKKKKEVKIGAREWDLLGGCKCSVGAVGTVPSEVKIKRSQIEAAPKKLPSHNNPTFEWIKQLSLQDWIRRTSACTHDSHFGGVCFGINLD